MAGGATVFLGIVHPQQFGLGMADKNFFPAHILGRQDHRLTRADVAGFAAIHDTSIQGSLIWRISTEELFTFFFSSPCN